MPYRVRTPDGELEFPSLADVAQAYSAGLVDPQDEVQEPGASGWRRADSLPVLAGSRAKAREPSLAQGRSVLLAAVLGLFSLYLMFWREGRGARLLGFVLALALAFHLSRVLSRSWRRGG